MSSQSPHLSRAQKRFLKKIASFFYITVTVVIVTVFLRDWSQVLTIDSSPRTRQLRSVKIYTELELITPRTLPGEEIKVAPTQTTEKPVSVTIDPSFPVSTADVPTKRR